MVVIQNLGKGFFYVDRLPQQSRLAIFTVPGLQLDEKGAGVSVLVTANYRASISLIVRSKFQTFTL